MGATRNLLLAVKPIMGILYSPENIRDWLILELFIQGTGMRSDVIRNLTLSNLTTGEPSPDGKHKVVQVGQHKTARFHGSMRLFIPNRLHNLLLHFCSELYADSFKKHLQNSAKTEEEKQSAKTMQPSDKVFVSNRGNHLQSIQSCMDLWLKFIPQSFGEWRPTSVDFRRYCETVFQSSEDPETRENAPRMIGHCQKTARERYVQKSEQT